MFTKLMTIKSRIVVLVTCFALVVSMLVATLGFYFMYTMQRRSTVQSTEFNLHLVANVLQQDLVELTALASSCAVDADVIHYLESDEVGAAEAIAIHEYLRDAYGACRSMQYVLRLMLVDVAGAKIVQVGSGIAKSHPITQYNIQELLPALGSTNYHWDRLLDDPYMLVDSLVLPYSDVVIGSGGEVVGYVFLAADPALVTDKLRGYTGDNDNLQLYTRLGWEVRTLELGDAVTTTGGSAYHFRNVVPEGTIVRKGPADDEVERTSTVVELVDYEGRRWLSISCPVWEDIALTQLIATDSFSVAQGIWLTLLAAVLLLILLLAVIIASLLNRNINQPIQRLQARMRRIGEGDFAVDESLEGEDEIGQMGVAINKLTQDVRALMDKRLADEKNKRDLEYRMLQSQINPHFLYNTLNSIKWMATIQKAPGIAEMTTSLSRLLKTASKDKRRMVTLADELALLDDYMVIQYYRYGGSIRLEKHVDDDALLQTAIPRFALQPIVENAIFHGIEPKRGGTITLRVMRGGGGVLVSVHDDGVGMEQDVVRGLLEDNRNSDSMFEELGVRAVDRRLRLAFGEEYGLSVQSKRDEFTTMVLRLPLEYKGEEQNAGDS